DGWETWMVGAGGLAGVWRTGRFEAAPPVTDADLADVSVHDAYGGVAVGVGGVVITSEDGNAWALDADAAALVEAEGGGDLRAVEVLEDGTVWVAGEAGLLLHRGADGWERVDLGTDADLRDLAFASRDRGLVADADGVLWWTRDRGETWEAAAAPGDVRAVAYDGGERGPTAWAVGGGGEVWSTEDGELWRLEARTSDGTPLTTIATHGDYVVAAGESGAVIA
ncbi:MAG: WD40/YVTN/BNR-like repeat-containing protein, partial [Myxococcota bacterium]